MSFEIVEMENLSGDKAHIYSVLFEGEDNTLLEQFFCENYEYKEDIGIIRDKIISMAKYTGCREQFFKEGEGNFADGIRALWYKNLRLYCMYFNRTVVLFGSGGIKECRTYQEDAELDKKVSKLKYVASKINAAIKDGTIKIGDDGVLDTDNFEVYD